MANAEEHQAKADRNREFIATIKDDKHCDWAAVAAFYVAVHLVEKLRALRGEHSQSHFERNHIVRTGYRGIHRHFRELYNWSLIARYNTIPDFTRSAQDVRTILIDHHLAEIEQFVASQSATIAPATP